MIYISSANSTIFILPNQTVRIVLVFKIILRLISIVAIFILAKFVIKSG